MNDNIEKEISQDLQLLANEIYKDLKNESGTGMFVTMSNNLSYIVLKGNKKKAFAAYKLLLVLNKYSLDEIYEFIHDKATEEEKQMIKEHL